ncbi:MAG: crosslink repair DNA glycosylase YcaQ family protein, partial [Pseudomonadota bacterium]
LAVCHRRGFRKFYDLSERVIPGEVQNSRLDDEEIIDWALTAALARLGFATSGELAAFFDIVTPQVAKDWCAKALAAGLLVEADVEMSDGRLRRCFVTEETLDTVRSLPAPTNRVRLLSPFDPVLRDRVRTERLFGFHYRIEIFVPEAKRKYGYYVFPVLQGNRVIGRLDARRTNKALSIGAFWPEAGVRMGKARTSGLVSELERVCGLAGVKDVGFEADWIRV